MLSCYSSEPGAVVALSIAIGGGVDRGSAANDTAIWMNKRRGKRARSMIVI